MKKQIDRLFLTAGCLFLALTLVLLIQGITKSYEKVCTPETYRVVQGESLYENRKESVFMRGERVLIYIADSFIHAYNECGYYDSSLSYLGIGQADIGQVDIGQVDIGQADIGQADAKNYDTDLQYGLILLYLLIVLLLSVPVLAGGFTGHIYILTGGVLAIILLLGKVPEYKYLVMLVMGWIYVHLIKSWGNRKEKAGFREFLREFPVMLLPGLVFVLLMFVLLPCLMPSEKLPGADEQTKNVIFSQLQKIHLVSDQYEENLKQKNQKVETQRQKERNNNTEESVQVVSQENSESDGFVSGEQYSEENEAVLTSGEEYQNPAERYQESSEPLAGEGNLSAKNGNESRVQGKTGDGAGFSLNSGGGVSGGRTDRAGNLSFSGKNVMEVISDSKPVNNLYIRLFYAEKYENNRWNAWDEEQYEQNSQKLVLGSNSAAEERYPEQEMYIDSICRVVPENLEKLFEERFEDRAGGIFEKGAEDFSQEEIIGKVKQILGDAACYTLSPGNVPEDEDFITWFLTKNKKGYCMHFASAGVMMLRSAGISSRYAEGYFVPVSAWKEQKDGSWCAQIQDSNAHAWAEIYQPAEGAVGEDCLVENPAVEDLAGEDWVVENSESRLRDNSGEYLYETGCWVPVELTPAYDGELAGSFAGQQDIYAGRAVIPGVVVFVITGVLILAGIVLLAEACLLAYRKCAAFYEYRMIHTGDNRQDIKNMMGLLMKKMIRKNRNVRKLMNADQLKREEFTGQISALIPDFGQNEEALEYFNRFSNYVYKAAFGADISKKEKKEAQFLYRKLMKVLTVEKKQFSRD